MPRPKPPYTRVAVVVVSALAVVAGAVEVAASPATAAGVMRAHADTRAAVAGPPGYWLAGEDGGIFAFDAPFAGSAAADPSRCPPNTTDRALPQGTCFSLAATPDGGGYWVLDGDTNRIFSFGTATSFGQPADSLAGVSREFVPTGVAMASTPSGHGYWVLERGASNGGSVKAFGDATFLGDASAIPTNGQPVALAATPDGGGYWLAFSDGGVFTYGDAGFFGSMGGRRLNQPVVGIAATADGKGYWLVARDGGVFAFGDAAFAGSMGGTALAAAMVGMAANPDGPGYWTVAADGGVFAFGGAPFLGSMGGRPLRAPVVAMAVRH